MVYRCYQDAAEPPLAPVTQVFNIAVWFFFLFVYSCCVRTPLDSINPNKKFDFWEIALYTMAASFLMEGTTR
jgi:hypothetical protein